MARAEEYAQWIVDNADKKGTPEFDTVSQAYQKAKLLTQPKEDFGRQFGKVMDTVSVEDFSKKSLGGSAANYLFQKSPVGKMLPNMVASLLPVSPEQQGQLTGLDKPVTPANIAEQVTSGGPLQQNLQEQARKNVIDYDPKKGLTGAYGGMAQGIASAVASPVETAKGLYDLATERPGELSGEIAKGVLYDPQFLPNSVLQKPITAPINTIKDIGAARDVVKYGIGDSAFAPISKEEVTRALDLGLIKERDAAKILPHGVETGKVLREGKKFQGAVENYLNQPAWLRVITPMLEAGSLAGNMMGIPTPTGAIAAGRLGYGGYEALGNLPPGKLKAVEPPSGMPTGTTAFAGKDGTQFGKSPVDVTIKSVEPTPLSETSWLDQQIAAAKAAGRDVPELKPLEPTGTQATGAVAPTPLSIADRIVEYRTKQPDLSREGIESSLIQVRKSEILAENKAAGTPLSPKAAQELAAKQVRKEYGALEQREKIARVEESNRLAAERRAAEAAAFKPVEEVKPVALSLEEQVGNNPILEQIRARQNQPQPVTTRSIEPTPVAAAPVSTSRPAQPDRLAAMRQKLDELPKNETPLSAAEEAAMKKEMNSALKDFKKSQVDEVLDDFASGSADVRPEGYKGYQTSSIDPSGFDKATNKKAAWLLKNGVDQLPIIEGMTPKQVINTIYTKASKRKK